MKIGAEEGDPLRQPGLAGEPQALGQLALGNIAGEHPAAVARGQMPGRRAQAAGDLENPRGGREGQIVRHGPHRALLGVAQGIVFLLEQSQVKMLAPHWLHGDAKAARVEVPGFGEIALSSCVGQG